MSSTRGTVLCNLTLLQVILCQQPRFCDISASVPLLFPVHDHLFGYGNSGLYRTEGIALTLQCSFNDPNEGVVALEILDGNNEITAIKAEKFSNNITSIMSYTLVNLIPGSQFRCQCTVLMYLNVAVNLPKMLSSMPIHIPSIQPCDRAHCQASAEDVCYQDKNGDVLKSQNPLLCEVDALESIKWNLPLSMRRFNSMEKSSGSIEIIHVSYNPHMGLCKNRKTNTTRSRVPLDDCQYVQLMRMLQNGTIHKRIGIRPCLYKESMDIRLDGKRIYSGTIHYIKESEVGKLIMEVDKRQLFSGTTTNTFQCDMFTWKRGSNPKTASSFPMIAVEQKTQSVGFITWTIRGKDVHPLDSGMITMVGCNHIQMIEVQSSHLPFYTKQVEFFARQFEVYPIYDPSGNFRGCRTESDDSVVNTSKFDDAETQPKCVCPPIYSCNPIRTVRNMSGIVFPCTLHKATSNPTSLQLTSSEVEITTSRQNATIASIPEYSTLFIFGLCVLVVLVLCNIVTAAVHLHLYLQRAPPTKRGSSMSGSKAASQSEDLSDPLPSHMYSSDGTSSSDSGSGKLFNKVSVSPIHEHPMEGELSERVSANNANTENDSDTDYLNLEEAK